MPAPTLLKEYRSHISNIYILRQRINDAGAELRQIEAERKMRQAPPTAERLREELAAHLYIIIKDARQQIRREAAACRQAEKVIDSIKDETNREILRLRYTSGPQPPTWHEIAEVVSYSSRMVQRRHGAALAGLGMIHTTHTTHTRGKC